MYCVKCGTEIPEGSTFCGSCGTPVSEPSDKGRESEVVKVLSGWIKRNTPSVITAAGSLLIIIGAFLPWERIRLYNSSSYDSLGVNSIYGGSARELCVLAVLSLAALVLAESKTVGKWRTVILLLSALALAFVCQNLYYMKDNDVSILVGFWVSLSGTVIMTQGGLLLHQEPTPRL